MRRLITFLFVLSLLGAIGLTILAPTEPLVQPVQIAALILFVLAIVDRIFGLFPSRRGNKTPRSQVVEMERLYFRSMREMLSETPNFVQVTNDLQRILSIDPYYKNAQHYLNRSILLQAEEGANNGPGARTRNSTEFMRLQDQLIDPEPNIRKSVVMELIQYGEDAIDPLIALLMDEDSDVRVHAATALGWIGGKDAVQPLMVAVQDENPYVRRYAARAMCWVVDDTAIEGLIAALQDEDSYVRQYAARALGWSQDRRAVEPLLKLLITEQSNDVREYTFTALDDLGEKNVRVERPIEVKD
ncbi:MAG: HEAT repeat domain-containing protein [Anaerolineae bacterium]|nr:HEAT repeat domain-containing protein [Anaerolineae bacterium]